MDLIDDAVGDAAERIAGAGGQEEMEGFGRRDEDVRRPANQPLPFGGGSIPGAHGRLQDGQRLAHVLGHLGNTLQRDLQVAVDVIVQRLQGRDIEHARASGEGRLPPECIEASEKGGQSLAGAGGRKDERILPKGDARPAEELG